MPRRFPDPDVFWRIPERERRALYDTDPSLYQVIERESLYLTMAHGRATESYGREILREKDRKATQED